ncbi:MAG: Crp/Fnr family transcriptional regulator [Bdellovibrionaceae bacterium]|nr:Crp/Fnr family transcriptional regulator [Pseudobdellovibrionaceae bacterium]
MTATAKKDSCLTCDAKHTSALCSSPDVLRIIDSIKVNCHYKAGQMIFQQGQEPLGLFAVQSGLVKLEVNSHDGHAHTLRILGTGGVVGYRSLFAREPYKANAIAMEDTSLCYIPKTELFQVFVEHPEATLNFMQSICKDLRSAEEKWVDQMDKEASERVAEAILFLQDHFHDQKWTRKEIAQWAGTTPETVMRALSQFEKDGLIEQAGRRIIILNRAGLHSKAAQI